MDQTLFMNKKSNTAEKLFLKQNIQAVLPSTTKKYYQNHCDSHHVLVIIETRR